VGPRWTQPAIGAPVKAGNTPRTLAGSCASNPWKSERRNGFHLGRIGTAFAQSKIDHPLRGTLVRCGVCRRELAEAEPVYRRRQNDVFWRQFNPRRRYGDIGFACQACADEHWNPNRGYYWRSEPKPCACCGRPVIGIGKSGQVPRHVACGPECKAKVYLELAKTPRKRPARFCPICAKEFEPRRTDSRYCSAACRQKSFRVRHSPLARDGTAFGQSEIILVRRIGRPL
jgi:hypothetical protein